jgi:small subunit ribosomal protein S4
MSRYTGPVCRLCRREGTKLFLKGDRCYTNKCSVGRRAYPPGQHGQGRKKASEYGTQLREKQKLRRIFGVHEAQFARYFSIAEKKRGVTGENLLAVLEMRLDNVAYRLGLAESRPQGRQLVRHGHFTVNGKKVSIPSYVVRPGDEIAVRQSSRSMEHFKAIMESAAPTLPAWLSLGEDHLSGKVLSVPSRDQIDLDIQEHLIVELYSK